MSVPSEEEIKELLTSQNKEEIDRGVEYAFNKYQETVRHAFLQNGCHKLSGPDLDHLCGSVWIALMENARKRKYIADGSLEAYLCRIAINKCLKFHRDQGRKAGKEFTTDEVWTQPDLLLDLLTDMSDLHPEELRALLTQRDMNILKDCLKILSEQDWDIFWFYYFDDYSTREIAELYERKTNWVKQRLFVSRKKLQECRDEKLNQ